MSSWKVKEVKRAEPYRYLIIMLEQDGDHKPCGHERYQTKEQAVARAKLLASTGQRCDVLVDVAASLGTEEDMEYTGKVKGQWSSTYPNPQNIPREQALKFPSNQEVSLLVWNVHLKAQSIPGVSVFNAAEMSAAALMEMIKDLNS